MSKVRAQIESSLNESIDLVSSLLSNKSYLSSIEALSSSIITTFQKGGSVFIAGNGGSAAEAQHFTGELVSRFMTDRQPLPAVSLAADIASMTAISNDYGFEHVFSRQLKGLARKDDLFIGISTSGRSENILNSFRVCSEVGITSAGLCGLAGFSSLMPDILLSAPSHSTPRIQEIHTITTHLACQIVEDQILNNNA